MTLEFGKIDDTLAFPERDYARAVSIAINDGDAPLVSSQLEELADLLDKVNLRGYGNWPAAVFLHAVISLRDTLEPDGDPTRFGRTHALFEEKYEAPVCCPFTGALCALPPGTVTGDALQAALTQCAYMIDHAYESCSRVELMTNLQSVLMSRKRSRAEMSQSRQREGKSETKGKVDDSVRIRLRRTDDDWLADAEPSVISQNVYQRVRGFYMLPGAGRETVTLPTLPELTLRRTDGGSFENLLMEVITQLASAKDDAPKLVAAELLRMVSL